MTNPWGAKSVTVPAPPPPAKPAQKNGYLVVKVKSRKGNKAVKGANVQVSGAKSAKGTTKANGEASFAGMPAGNYSVDADAPDFEPGKATATVESGKTGPAAEVVLAPKLLVTVRSSFVNPGEGECWVPGEAVVKASIELDGKPATDGGKTTVSATVSSGVAVTGTPRSSNLPAKWVAKTDRDVGQVLVSLAKVTDGEHELTIVPDSSMTSACRAEPALADTGTRAYRPFKVKITVADGALNAATAVPPEDGHGYVTGVDKFELAVDLKPDWMRAAKHGGARTTIDCIVVHHTGGKIIGTALNEGLQNKGPHYEIDLDGHVVKLVQDANIAYHAGTSRWGGTLGVNSFAIGIEVVNKSGAFTDAQYTSLIALLKSLTAAHGIASHRIVGHSDVRTEDKPGDNTLLSDDRAECPGREFDWARLESEGLGWVLKEVELGDYYAGYFSSGDAPVMKKGDADAGKVYGGKKRTDFPPAGTTTGPIWELQDDLEHIGYSLVVNGTYDEHTRKAVDRFQRHYFSGSHKAELPDSRLGILDARTAIMIKTVRGSLP